MTVHVSTHVLDAVTGRPAAGVPVRLTTADGTVLAETRTDDQGRVTDLYTGDLGGVFRLRLDTAAYFTACGATGFYPEVVISFHVDDPDGNYHVPLLLSPHAYSTYRGS